ncbi:MAG: tetratricopeptide repeat protein [Pyrinomonadaceae bacterium]
MLDWLHPLLLMFYAPSRGMSEVRDRAPLAPAMLFALLADASYMLYTQWPFLVEGFGTRGAFASALLLFRSAKHLLFIALVLVPVIAFIANLFERRGSFGLVLQQEYAPLASTIFYAWTAANILAIPVAVLAKVSGFQAQVLANSMQVAAQWQARLPQDAPPLASPRLLTEGFARMILLPLFAVWAAMAVRKVFQLSPGRTIAVMLLSAVVLFILAPLLMPVFGWVFASPFLLIILFLLLRGYIGEVTSTQRRRASFKQNLEAATLNPADASAHYNLGLLHLQRSELDNARQRFERAIEIDPEEIDAHFQLGRIARAQNLLPDAIKHFEQVVTRDDTHAQHEIWREIGATYIAAGQFDDALDALEKFLDRRTNDPEGLYLMGRALAGMGRQREAAERMQACIEAVKTAPAYKYRTEKRWLNEAQQFLRSQV